MQTDSYTVQGMTCDHCAVSITAEVRKLGGVDDIAVDVAAGRVTVTSTVPLPTDAIREAVEEAGYELVDA